MRGLIRCLSRYEMRCRVSGFPVYCRDGRQVGRGALFGPVFAAAVVLDPGATSGAYATARFWMRNREPAFPRRSSVNARLGQWGPRMRSRSTKSIFIRYPA